MISSPSPAPATTRTTARKFGPPLLALLAILSVYGIVTFGSARQTSATFDEILLPAAGARGYATGDFDLVQRYHPRILPYLYGLPVHLAQPELPEELGQWEGSSGFSYARSLFFERNPDPQSLLMSARMVAILLAMGLIALVFVFVHRHVGARSAILAATLMAFLPDTLAHGGIAYNDVPVAAAFFASVWALDHAARTLKLRDAILAALLTGLALGVKYSALALGPIAFILVGIEAVRRGAEWRRYLIRALSLMFVGGGVIYLFLVTVYLGDFTLRTFRTGMGLVVGYGVAGNTAPTWFLGSMHPEGVWYFYPMAFLIKTPVAFHLLGTLAVVGLVMRAPGPWREILETPFRGPIVAAIVLAGALLTSSLQIGFRHAMPMLPFLVVLVVVGVDRLTRGSAPSRGRRPLRALVIGLAAAHVALVLSWYPHFIPYTSEYFPDRDRGHTLIADSSHDWGQGLIVLRDFMEEEGVRSIDLSYFGSALPEAYGIEYDPLPSFFPLPDAEATTGPNRFMAISATNLGGAYIDEALAAYRDLEPYRVLGHTMFIFERADVPIPEGEGSDG